MSSSNSTGQKYMVNRSRQEFDSADELENTVAEDKTLFQKVPESLINININFCSNRNRVQADPAMTNQAEFPIKETSKNSQSHLRKLSEGKDETLKRMIYNRSPKEVASEYFCKRENPVKNLVQTDGTRIASPSSKKFLYSFNQSNKQQNQENLERNQRINANQGHAASTKSQEILTNRLFKEAELKTEYKKVLVDTYLNKELRECTFKPKTMNDKPRRTFEQFLEDQNNFYLQAQVKKKELEEQSLAAARSFEEGLYKPEINADSIKMVKNKSNQKLAVHERLYNSGKTTHNKLLENISARGIGSTDRSPYTSNEFIGPIGSETHEKQDATFIPNIQDRSKNLKRNEPVEARLYSDAFRRNNKGVQESQAKYQPTSTTMSSKSKKAIAKRFIKEFDIAILEFLDEEKEPVLNYIQLNQLLQKLHFLKVSEQIENPNFGSERLLLHNMWNTLFGEKFQGVHRRNILVFLLSVLNLHFPITKIPRTEPNVSTGHLKYSSLDRNSNILKSPSSERENLIGYFDEAENYILTEEEVKTISKKFEVLHFNRLSSSDNIGQLISSKNYNEHKYQPEINNFSRNLAQTYRQKIIEGASELIEQNKISVPQHGKLSHAELLILSKKLTEEKLNNHEEVLRKDEAKNCTFKPQTNQNNCALIHESGLQSSANFQETDRAHELYLLNKPQVFKRDKTTLEIEYEKNKDECTFRPNFYTRRGSNPLNSQEEAPKGTEKAIERIRNAQAEKELQKMKMQRGFSTGTERNWTFTLESNKCEKKAKQNRIKSNTSSQTIPSPQYDLGIASPKLDASENNPLEMVKHNGLKVSKDQIEGNDEGQERVPLLFVDVNLGQGRADKIVVYEGDTAEDLAEIFSIEHGLDPSMKVKLKAMLEIQIAGVLGKIDEEANSESSDADRHHHSNLDY